MTDSAVTSHDVLLVRLPEHVPPGHEQEGARPVIVVGLPERLGVARFDMLIVVPVTTKAGKWSQKNPKLYPQFKAGTAGLTYDSVALMEHVRSIDVSRVVRFLGSMTPDEYKPIGQGLKAMLDLSD